MEKEESEYKRETNAIIASYFEIEGYNHEENYSEEEVLQVLANQVAVWMDTRFEQLMSLMYTMDISEEKVSEALHPLSDSPSNIALAELIYHRQLKRVETKYKYSQEGPADWEDF